MKIYGELALTDSSPAQQFQEPLSLDLVKASLRVSTDLEDVLISQQISTARRQAEIATHLDLIQKQYDLGLDILLGYDALAGTGYPLRYSNPWNFGAGLEIQLRYPLRSVDLFTYTDSNNQVTALVQDVDYIVDTKRALVTPVYGKLWPFFTPHPSSAVLIRFSSGYSSTHPFWLDDGMVVKQAMQLFVAGWYENRIPYGDRRGQIDEYPYSMTQLLQSIARPQVN